MKRKLFLFLFLSLTILSIYSSIIYVYDAETNDTIPFVVIEYSTIKRQCMVPFEFNNDSLYISSIGYMSKWVYIDNDTVDVYLKRESIQFDTIYVKDNYTSTDFKIINNNGKDDFLYNFNNLLYIKNYGRTKTLSIDNSRAEEINISINNQEISIPSGISDINLIPIIIFNQIGISKFNKNNLGHYNNIDFSHIYKNGTLIILSGNTDNKRIAAMMKRNGMGLAYEYADYDCLKLTNGEKLQNSYLNKKGFLFFIDKKNFQFLMFNSFTKTGDPGIMGFHFDSAYTKQYLKHIQISNSNNLFSISTVINHYNYNYNNMEIGSINDSANALNAYSFINTKHFGFGLEYDYLNGTKTGKHLKINPFLLLSYQLNKVNTNIRIDNLSSSTFNTVYKNNLYKTGFIFKLRDPTFNELYWNDIYAKGNDTLKNEKIINIFYITKKHYNAINLQYEIGLKLSFDLINWQSVNGVFMPVNNQKVYMPYTKILLSTQYRNIFINGFFNINPCIIDKNDNYTYFIKSLYEKQIINITQYFAILPYSTIYTFGGNIIFSYNKFNISMNSIFVSRRYINTYNTKYLNQYFIINNISVSYKYNIIDCSIDFNNPLNVYFENVRGYPNEGYNIMLNFKMEVL